MQDGQQTVIPFIYQKQKKGNKRNGEIAQVEKTQENRRSRSYLSISILCMYILLKLGMLSKGVPHETQKSRVLYICA